MGRTTLLYFFMPGLALFVTTLPAQIPPVTIQEFEIANYINYYADVTDPLKMGTSPQVSPVQSGFNSTWKLQVGVGDLVSVNGKAAKGIFVLRALPLNLSPTPAPGRMIADVGRIAVYDGFMEIQQADGTPVGAIMVAGLGGGAAPPGAPAAALFSNLGVTTGTGPFLGVRGQMEVSGGTTRAASMVEDPALRRVNGGGTLRMITHLIPMAWPEVWILPAGPAVFHAADFSPVTADKPARAGELLIMGVKGLGPVKGKVDPGQPFPAGDLLEVNSPVEVMVNGKSATVGNKVGWPATTDVYRVDFVVPEGTAPGMASVVPIVAWINGSEVKIPVR